MFTSRTANVLLCAVMTLGMHDGYATGFPDSMEPGLFDGASPKPASAAPAFNIEQKIKVHGGKPSPDAKIVEIPACVAVQSRFIQDLVEDNLKEEFDQTEFDQQEPSPLENVKSATLDKVIKYMAYHAPVDHPAFTIKFSDENTEGFEGHGAAGEIQKPLKSTNLIECGVSEWDAEYVNIEQETLFELILAANYLHIPSLLDLTCAKVASMIKGKSTEEIRKQFKIVNDFTPEEEEQVREENRWCQDA